MITARTAAVVAVAFVAAVASAARADDEAKACADAFELTQSEQLAGRLLAAKRDATRCGAASCPDFVRPECAKLLATIQESIPTVVVVARTSAGVDLADAVVWIDGRRTAATANGKPIEVDPGGHVIRVVVGGVAAERSVVLAQGQKNKLIELVVAPSPPTPRPVTPPTARASSPAVASGGTPPLGPQRTAAIAVGAVALLGVIAGGTFAGLAKAQYGKSDGHCDADNFCDDEGLTDRRGAFAKAMGANVTFAFAGAAAAAAFTLWFTAPSSRSAPRLGFSPSGFAVAGSWE